MVGTRLAGGYGFIVHDSAPGIPSKKASPGGETGDRDGVIVHDSVPKSLSKKGAPVDA